MKQTLLALLMVLSACSPARLQSTNIVGLDEQGRSIYAMTGFGDPNDMAPGSSIKHVTYALSDVCPAGVKVLDLQEYPGRSILNDFWYWEAKARCE